MDGWMGAGVGVCVTADAAAAAATPPPPLPPWLCTQYIRSVRPSLIERSSPPLPSPIDHRARRYHTSIHTHGAEKQQGNHSSVGQSNHPSI
mmetsp:Transcript_47068/g.117411  ORF Transcript_47068/g.117411 Transcript_47068/m.117411 type:complete len:91 (-) Transcript_47068:339-611(-)